MRSLSEHSFLCISSYGFACLIFCLFIGSTYLACCQLKSGPATQELLLRAFGERMRERGVGNLAEWAAGRGELALELLRGWKVQAAVSEFYGCSQRVVAAGAGVFAHGLTGGQAEDWALLQFECLLQHALPPSHGTSPESSSPSHRCSQPG